MLTIRISSELAAELDSEARRRGLARSIVVRERLQRPSPTSVADPLASIRHLIGSVDGGPPDLSARKKHYLREWGFGRKRPR
jgi:hypothetical protein